MTCKHKWGRKIIDLDNCPYCTIERQAAEIVALRRDAERYRFLRMQKENLMQCFEDAGPHNFGMADVCEGLSNEYLDAAIDAALSRENAGG